MIAEILATGDEVLNGTIVDSNSAYIAEKLEAADVAVMRHHCVGDDMGQLVEVLQSIGARAEVCVVTGGLGPTTDDLSAEAAAAAAGVPLEEHKEALAAVEAFFAQRNYPMNPSNRKQALLPQTARCLLNPVGTAPGFTLEIGRCLFYFLPGVPHEMHRMLDDHVLPDLFRRQGQGIVHNHLLTIRSFGLTESGANESLRGFRQHFPGIRLGYRARFPEIHIKLAVRGADLQQMEEQIRQGRAWVMERIGDYVFSTDGADMEAVVGRLLIERQQTVALAESCTGGLVASRMTDVPGSSRYFMTSAVTYADAAKEQLLGVRRQSLFDHGAVSEAVALEMAHGVRRISGATYGLSTSGIAGPDGGSAEKPVGTVCIALVWPEGDYVRRYYFPFPRRSMNKEIFAVTAMELLRRKLSNLPLQAPRRK